MIDSTSVIGYARPMSVSPGEKVSFHLSSADVASAEIRVVRVRCGDPDQNGPGLKLIHAPSDLDGEVGLSHQPMHNGSFGIVADNALLAGLTEFSFGCYIFPTVVGGAAADHRVALERQDRVRLEAETRHRGPSHDERRPFG